MSTVKLNNYVSQCCHLKKVKFPQTCSIFPTNSHKLKTDFHKNSHKLYKAQVQNQIVFYINTSRNESRITDNLKNPIVAVTCKENGFHIRHHQVIFLYLTPRIIFGDEILHHFFGWPEGHTCFIF